MSSEMSCIRVNDIFDELIDENKRLKQCLDVLIRFKTFIDIIYNKIKGSLNLNESQEIYKLQKDIKEVFGSDLEDFVANINSNHVFKCDIYEESPKKLNNSLGSNEKIKRNKPKEKPLNEIKVCHFIGGPQEFHTTDSLQRHTKTHPISENGKKFVCNHIGCKFETNRGTDFRDHTNRHIGQKPYECDSCDKRFCSRNSLSSHRKKIHPSNTLLPQNSFKCGINGCERAFDSLVGVTLHKREFHFKVRPFKCQYDNCGYSAIRQYLLDNHIHAQHIKDRHFKCSIEGCDKNYKDPYALSAHIKTHDPNFGFKCTHEGCHKSFSKSQTLKDHLICSHSNIRFQCDWPGCEFITGRKASLKLHTKESHCADKNVLCMWPQCTKSFNSKRKLTIHLRIHKNDKRYVCCWPGCQYRCTDSGNMVKHKKIHQRI